MADLVSELASKAGVSTEQARKGLGAVLALLKDKLPGNVFSQIQSAVPGAEGLMTDAKAAPEASGSLLDTVKEMAGKLFGGSGALASNLSRLGFSAEQGQNFLSTVLDFLKNKLPPDVMDKLSGLIPTGVKAGA